MKPIDYKKELEKQSVPTSSQQPDPTCCGPTCDCNATSSSNWIKVGTVIVVLIAATVILTVKLVGKPDSSVSESNSVSRKNTAELPPPGVSTPLKSIAELNTVAANLDAVFVTIPGNATKTDGQALMRVIDLVRQKLADREISVGIFTLRIDSPDYRKLAENRVLPAVAVLAGVAPDSPASVDSIAKGMLTGKITESNLIQSYVSASIGIGGGCDCADKATCGGN